LRDRFELSQGQLAALLGVSVPSISRWEHGQLQPAQPLWQLLARAEHEGLAALDGHRAGVGRIREPGAAYQASADASPLAPFTGQPDAVRLVVEAHRLAYGYLINPALATEVSLIEPLPHQRIAVYERMLTQSRLRFLLADDAGAGKTIMTGLYIREMLARRLIRRVLIVPPAGLVGNWRHELETLFSLPFTIVTGADVRTANPFVGPASDQMIVSVDTLAGDRVFEHLQDPTVAPYDLVVFDEAHKLSADREPDLSIRKTERYRLAEALAGIPSDNRRWQLEWSAHHLLLLTATPHMGKDYPYYALWRLLEPEALSTVDAFNEYPPTARQDHFIRRTKEEMVYFDGRSIYPQRQCDTLSYDLTPGEQELYEATTNYIQQYYNQVGILNRSAVRLAMSVFQRRLASSTFAVLRSFERRLERLDGLIADIQSGRLSEAELRQQRRPAPDLFEEKTADEEASVDGREEHELTEDEALGAVAARTLAELMVERDRVRQLRELAQRVYDAGDEAKFRKLREVLLAPEYAHEKFIVFTEHRDTLEFLTRRLEGLGHAGQIAHIHGGMDFEERERQVASFRQPLMEGGARYLLATDAAGEGINLQFCWLMVNYDLPWNPARLEQRMGRIHRFGQRHDPVIITNLIAGKTREGRVMATLLDKLERIRREMRADKVFDVVGRLFEGVSLRQYLEQATTEAGVVQAERAIAGALTRQQVEARQARERSLFGSGGDVVAELPRLRASMEEEVYRRLMPGYVRHFIEQAAPRLALEPRGDLDDTFTLRPLQPGAADALWPALERYRPEQRAAWTVYRPTDKERVIFLHPGEPVFEALRERVLESFGRVALAGAVFYDPAATGPYFVHVALLQIMRRADPALRALARPEALQYSLVGMRQDRDGAVTVCPIEQVLLLRDGGGMPGEAVPLIAVAEANGAAAQAFASATLAHERAEAQRERLRATLPQREQFVRQGYSFQEAELAEARRRVSPAARAGDPHARGELTRILERQMSLAARRDEALAVLRREPELIEPAEVLFLAHALVLPSRDPADQLRQDAEVEAIAVQVARAHEEALRAVVHDVSTAPLAVAAGLAEHPGFDLRSRRLDGSERAIEVKGRASTGDVEMTENEYIQACNLGDRYWLYVVFDCASVHPRLVRVQNPFQKLIARAKGSVVIDERSIFGAAESE
jgi:superfamily II DNA or RNA helicase